MSFSSSTTTSDVVALLSELVAFRSDRSSAGERALAEHLGALLKNKGADEVTLASVPRSGGEPEAAYVYARYGQPRLVINAHLDTVPPNAGWHTDPFVAHVNGDRFTALGAADTKGAIAAILCALGDATPRDTGILFSGDEEFSGVAMEAFVKSPHAKGLERAIVCEPTNLQTGTRHRGILSFDARVVGPGGHSSMADTVVSPVASLSRLGVALDAWAKRHRAVGPPGFLGMCVNLAKLDGGVAFNVIPSEARLEVSLRPPPGTDTNALWAELEALTRDVAPEALFQRVRDNAPFATTDLNAFSLLLPEATQTPIDLGFWTEAAVLAKHGIDAVVFGPGNIKEAHAPDEWVSISELARARTTFRRIFERN